MLAQQQIPRLQPGAPTPGAIRFLSHLGLLWFLLSVRPSVCLSVRVLKDQLLLPPAPSFSFPTCIPLGVFLSPGFSVGKTDFPLSPRLLLPTT